MSPSKICLFTALLILSTAKILAHESDTIHQTTDAKFICCPDTYVFDDDTLACVCPKESPFVDIAGKCISCPSPGYFDNGTKTCQQCPDIKVYDFNQKACVCPLRFYKD